MKRNLIPYLKDILDNLELAAGFTAGMSYEEFCLGKMGTDTIFLEAGKSNGPYVRRFWGSENIS